MISDHLQPWVTAQGHAGHVWTTIGAVAQATERLEVGTGVVAMINRSHPITVAHAAAAAAVLLEDRFFLGLGTGDRLNEQAFEAAAAQWHRDAIDTTVVCATGPEPVVRAIDRFVAAGYTTVYLHQIGPDQRRLADMVVSDLVGHYR